MTLILDVTATSHLALSVPASGLVRGTSLSEQVGSESMNVSFFDSRLVTKNWNWSRNVSIMHDALSQKWSQMAFFLPFYVLCLSLLLQAESFDDSVKFYFFLQPLFLCPSYLLLTLHNFSPQSVLYCALFNSDVQSNFLIAVFFFVLSPIKRRREFKSPPCLCPVLMYLSSYLRLWVASNTMTFGGNTTASFSDCSEPSDLLELLWTPSSRQFDSTCSLD